MLHSEQSNKLVITVEIAHGWLPNDHLKNDHTWNDMVERYSLITAFSSVVFRHFLAEAQDRRKTAKMTRVSNRIVIVGGLIQLQPTMKLSVISRWFS